MSDQGAAILIMVVGAACWTCMALAFSAMYYSRNGREFLVWFSASALATAMTFIGVVVSTALVMGR